MSDTMIAVHEERIANMQDRLLALEGKVDNIDMNVTSILVTLGEIRGGWKAILGLSAMVGGIVSFVVGRLM